LNALVRSHVVLRLPTIEVLSVAQLKEKAMSLGQDSFSVVRLGFRGPFAGNATLIFLSISAAKLVTLLTGENYEPTDLDEIRTEVLTEVGNILLNGVMGIIGNELDQHLSYSVPLYLESRLDSLFASEGSEAESTVVWVQTQFTIHEHAIDGNVVLLFEAGSLDLLPVAINRRLGMFL
jgi:chemotaxis protein CheC